jgi:hypothetical protein
MPTVTLHIGDVRDVMAMIVRTAPATNGDSSPSAWDKSTNKPNTTRS